MEDYLVIVYYIKFDLIIVKNMISMGVNPIVHFVEVVLIMVLI